MNVSGVYITIIVDGDVIYTTVTDENGIARIRNLPRKKNVLVKLRKSGYQPVDIIINNSADITPSTLTIKLIDKETEEIILTETKQLIPNQRTQYDYQIEGYQRIAGSVLIS
jgi:beta-lactamase regulating signal transducer with metallopeptidase domain